MLRVYTLIALIGLGTAIPASAQYDGNTNFDICMRDRCTRYTDQGDWSGFAACRESCLKDFYQVPCQRGRPCDIE